MNEKIKNGRRWLVSALAGVAGLALAIASPAPAQQSTTKSDEKKSDDKSAASDAKDTIIFRSGKVMEGKIISETATTVRVRVMMGGLSAETDYPKADILKIERAAAGETKEESAAVAKTAEAPKAKEPVKIPDTGAHRIYMLDLSGKFGEDITQTPIRDAVKDAKKNNVDTIIVSLQNEWKDDPFEEKGDEAVNGAFDELFRAESITPVFLKEIPMEWEHPPRVVFWVKNAMGGAMFLPLVCPEIYFRSDAKMGGIGNLTIMFGSTGDEVVRQKQYALRLKTAEGMALVGGYAPEIVDAMADVFYVLSVEYIGGKPYFYERMPNPGSREILLTDDANLEEGRRDTIQQLARGEGNDILVLNAKLAKDLLVSKGTADTVDDLIFQMGLSRNYTMIDGASKRIMTGWTKNLDDAKRELRKLWDDFQSVRVAAPGDFEQRQQARSTRTHIIDQMEDLMKRYGEGLTRRFYAQAGIPPKQRLDLIRVQLKLEQLADKK